MTAKDYLKQYRFLTVKIENLEKDIEKIREERSSITLNYDGMPKGGGISDKTASLAAKLVDMEIELIDLRSEAWTARMRIINTIGEVRNADYNAILHMRYIDCYTWEKIAVEMDFTYQWVCVLHGRALDEVAKILKLS